MPDMTYSNALETYSPSDVPNEDGLNVSTRKPVAGTIPRGWIPADEKIRTNDAYLMSYMAKNHFTHDAAKMEEEYAKAASFLKHTGIWINSYKQYLTWGSIASPYYTIGLWLLNWSFWFTMFFLIGGPALACGLFTGALFWFVLVRLFNYTGHGKGEVQRDHAGLEVVHAQGAGRGPDEQDLLECARSEAQLQVDDLG